MIKSYTAKNAVLNLVSFSFLILRNLQIMYVTIKKQLDEYSVPT